MGQGAKIRLQKITTTIDVLFEVLRERRRQDAKWGEQNWPDGTGGDGMRALAEAAKIRCGQLFVEGHGTWGAILEEEVREAFAESDPARLRAELIQIAAVAVQWCEALDRRAGR